MVVKITKSKELVYLHRPNRQKDGGKKTGLTNNMLFSSVRVCQWKGSKNPDTVSRLNEHVDSDKIQTGWISKNSLYSYQQCK